MLPNKSLQPTPATLLLLGLGAVMVARRRKILRFSLDSHR
jgi:hypothetical protein